MNNENKWSAVLAPGYQNYGKTNPKEGWRGEEERMILFLRDYTR